MITSHSIKEAQTVSNNWGKLENIVFETTNDKGECHEHKYELYDVGNGVAVLLYNRAKGTILLNRQFRIATVRNGNPSGMMAELCAGKIDDLSADETVVKEIWEETGYSISEVQHVMSMFSSPGAITERMELYVAAYTPEDKKGEGGGLREEGEDIAVEEVPFEEALAMIKEGVIRDAKTIVLLQYAALNGLFHK